MNTIETFEALVKDIEDRRGLKHEWAGIDSRVKGEIRLAWLAIIDQHKTPPPPPTCDASINISLTRIADALDRAFAKPKDVVAEVEADPPEHGFVCFWVGCTRTFADDTNRRKHMVDDHGDERFR